MFSDLIAIKLEIIKRTAQKQNETKEKHLHSIQEVGKRANTKRPEGNNKDRSRNKWIVY